MTSAQNWSPALDTFKALGFFVIWQSQKEQGERLNDRSKKKYLYLRPLWQDAAPSDSHSRQTARIYYSVPRTECHKKSWLVLLLRWYREWIWSPSIDGGNRESLSLFVCIQVTSSSAPVSIWGKANYIHIHAAFGRTNRRQRLCVSSRGKEAAFKITIRRGTLTVFTRSSIMSLRGTWHASFCLFQPGETEHLKPAISEKHTLCVGA